MWEEYLLDWHRRAIVRMQEPFKLDTYPGQHDRFHYPRAKLPICLHPLVRARGEETIRFMLLQACYQFMDEIAGIEENIVIDINTKILDRLYMPELSSDYRQVLRSITIDEYFHSMTSRSYCEQLEKLTGCEPIKFKATSTRNAMRKLSRYIEDPEVKELFELSVLCLVENTITNSLLDHLNDERCHDAFMDFNRGHIQDEAYHGKFYRELLVTAYQRAGIDKQRSVARILPLFIQNSLDAYKEKTDYAYMLLECCGFSAREAQTIVSESYPRTADDDYLSTLNVAAVRNLQLLSRIPVYHCADIQQRFERQGMVLRR